MLINPKFEYPEIQQVTLDSGFRYYTSDDSPLKMASVTTIIDNTSDKTALDAWKKRVGPVRAAAESHYATSVGSLMHSHVEAFIEGRERPSAATPPRKLASNMADLIIAQGLPHVSEVWGVEVRLYVPGLYAGTCDLIGLYKERAAIIDHKSSKKLKSKKDIVDYRDQMAAYIIAHNERYGTSIDLAVVFMATRDNNFQCIEYEADEITQGKSSFLDRVETFMKNAPEIMRT